MIDAPLVVSVDRPPPPELTPSALGVGFFGPPDSLSLVFHEELRDDEVDAIRSGRYRVALKLFSGGGVAGLVWRILAGGGDMIGLAPYSLRVVGDRGGEEALGSFRDAARGAGLAGSPGRGLPIRLVFVDPGSGLVFALRVFALPRLFSDQFLRAILATEDQDTAKTGAILAKLFEAGSAVWSMARPGIAVAGEEIELDEADFVRLLRSDRQRRQRP
jgi:hypothetical protein